jgi:hypothetical protein
MNTDLLLRTIQTYGQRGVAKQGAVKCQHSIIHTTREPRKPEDDEEPDALSGERPMLTAIRVKAGKPTDTMDKMARLNYTKIYTVEHNVKVYDFGKVHPDSLDVLKHQFRWVWQEGDEVEVEDDDDDESDEDDGDDSDDNDTSGGGRNTPQPRGPEKRNRRESSSKEKKKDDKKPSSSIFGGRKRR